MAYINEIDCSTCKGKGKIEVHRIDAVLKTRCGSKQSIVVSLPPPREWVVPLRPKRSYWFSETYGLEPEKFDTRKFKLEYISNGVAYYEEEA